MRRPVIAAVDRWLLAPAPAARFAALRLLVGGYAVVFLVVRAPGFWLVFATDEARFEPVGPLAWLARPLDPTVARAGFVVTAAVGLAFVAGWRWRVVGPAFALLFLATTTYRVSWGHVLHTDHLVALHLLVLGCAPAASVWSLDARRAGRGLRDATDPGPARSGWPIRIMAVLTVNVYVLSGLAKLRYGGADWLVGDVLRNQVAYDNLRKVLLGDIHSPIGGWASRFGWLFPPLAVATVAIELAAPVALLGRDRLRTVWVAGAWSFHVGIVALMAISFPYELVGIAYAPMFRIERLPAGLVRVGGVARRAFPRRRPTHYRPSRL